MHENCVKCEKWGHFCFVCFFNCNQAVITQPTTTTCISSVHDLKNIP